MKALEPHITKAKTLYLTYEHFLPAVFFLLGVIFDILTIDRIDQLFSNLQQAIYLSIVAVLLTDSLLESLRPPPDTTNYHWLKKTYLQYRLHALHFFLGSLLSCYTIFFFMSASFISSMVFLLILTAVLIANEFKSVHKLGAHFKFGLFSLCSISYFACLIPIVIGAIGTWIFVSSIFAGLLPILLVSRFLKKRNIDNTIIVKQIWRPSLIVLLVFLGLYLMRWIPPVPLSIKYMGIFHDVKKNAANQYQLAHENAWWRFWASGDQIFYAAPNDKIYVFFRLFSPTHFSDKVLLKWFLKEANGEWSLQDAIPINIIGGRDEGFRGYGVKSRYREGQWRATIETIDEREIGRIYFSVINISERKNSFEYEVQ